MDGDGAGIDFASPTWAAVRAWARAREEGIKEGLVADLAERDTVRLRAQVAMLRELCALEDLPVVGDVEDP